MFGRAKVEKTKRRTDPSQLGIFGVPDDIDEFEHAEDDADDGDLEAELLALTSGGGAKPKRKVPVKIPQANLDSMVAASLKDDPSDDDVSVNESDPELLAELGDLVSDPEQEDVVEKPPEIPKRVESSLQSVLNDRLQMYEKAEQNAKAAGEASRARRFARGIKTLKDQLKQAKAGRVVNEEDIPPPVAVTERKKEDTDGGTAPSDSSGPKNLEPPQFPPPTIPVNDHKEAVSPPGPEDQVLNTLTERRNAYRQEALNAKKNDDKEMAMKCVRIVKQFDSVIAAVKSGQPVDLSEMPPMPGAVNVPHRRAPLPPPRRPKQESVLVNSSEPEHGNDEQPTVTQPPEDPPAAAMAPAPPPPPAPTSVMEALEQRLQRYQEAEKSAKDEGNSSKARRMGRIVKQYQSAIAAHKSGKSVPFDELPTPPGFAPIPGQPAPPPLTMPNVDTTENETEEAPQEDVPAKSVGGNVVPNERKTPVISPPKSKAASSDEGGGHVGRQLTRQEHQLEELLKRQAVFKKAALEAKKNGDLAQAREHLRIAKGIDALIEASHSGLPVDMSTLPLPPEEKTALMETDFDFVTSEDCIPGSVSEVYEKLEENLLKQITMCISTRDHFRAIGDVGSGNRFDQLALDSKKDLDAVRAASISHKLEVAKVEASGMPYKAAPPRFHYESRTFSIVKCNTDLSDNDVELTIIRGINYNLASGAETYVRFEFPFPTDNPQKDRSSSGKDNNPSYEHTFLLAMQRSSRACQRVFKRQAVKLEVWSKGSCPCHFCCYSCGKSGCLDYIRGFFRGDSLVGTATVKLQTLETQCTIHDSFPLMEGRKAAGGKLEVKVRIRNPILGRQVEKVTEKWLIIDKL